MKRNSLVVKTMFLAFFLNPNPFEVIAQNNLARLVPGQITLIDGKVMKAGDMEKKIVVLNFWATWCAPCSKEIPDLNGLVMENKNSNDVLFLAIPSSERDNSGSVRDFLDENRFLFHHVHPKSVTNLNLVLANLRYPTTFVYDKQGILKYKFVGTLKKRELDEISKLIHKD